MPHCGGGGYLDPFFGLTAQGDCGAIAQHEEHPMNTPATITEETLA